MPFNFSARRTQLFDQIEPGSLVIIKGNRELIRNRDIDYEFRQNSYFYYLTGFTEPDAYAVFTKSLANEFGNYECTFTMYIKPYNASTAQWTGIATKLEEVGEKYGATKAESVEALDEQMPKLLLHAKHFYFLHPNSVSDLVEKELSSQKEEWLGATSRRGWDLTTHDLRAKLDLMRMIKSPEEIETLKEVSLISAQAHVQLMQYCQPGMKEKDLANLFEFFCKSKGCSKMAYSTIVAGADRAWCLHWPASAAELKSGDLVLVDAAGELDGYASDITRTFPVNGRFTEEQLIIYNIVLEAQEAAIAAIAAGVNIEKISTLIEDLLLAGLINHRIIKPLDESMPMDSKKVAYQEILKKLYPHGFGHFVGLDVHDAGRMRSIDDKWLNFEEGSLFTVEPGLYLAKDNLDLDEKWRGISVRIEDVIIVRKDSAEVITSAVPKKAADIEALMKDAKLLKQRELSVSSKSHYSALSPAVFFSPLSTKVDASTQTEQDTLKM